MKNLAARHFENPRPTPTKPLCRSHKAGGSRCTSLVIPAKAGTHPSAASQCRGESRPPPGLRRDDSHRMPERGPHLRSGGVTEHIDSQPLPCCTSALGAVLQQSAREDEPI